MALVRHAFGRAKGRLDAVWLDTRNAANNIASQLFYSYTQRGSSPGRLIVAVSAAFQSPSRYPNQNQMATTSPWFQITPETDVAYCATFNGEQDHLLCSRRADRVCDKNFADFNGDTFTDYLLFIRALETRPSGIGGNGFLSGVYGPTLPDELGGRRRGRHQSRYQT